MDCCSMQGEDQEVYKVNIGKQRIETPGWEGEELLAHFSHNWMQLPVLSRELSYASVPVSIVESKCSN